MGGGGLLVAASFFTIFVMGWRTTGPEVFGGRIWWNDKRPVHGALYTIFGALALRGHRLAWVPLALDAALGLVVYLLHHRIV